MTFNSGRGGKRTGAGRPLSSPTRVLRVSLDIADNIAHIESILALIQDYSIQSQDASSTSPRWEIMRRFLADVESIKNKDN